jgi:hypothetical protein
MAIGTEPSPADSRDPGGLRVGRQRASTASPSARSRGQGQSEWLPRLWQLLQASVVMIAPGVLAAWLASRGYPTSLRMCIRTVVAFASGRRSVTGLPCR